MQTLKYYLQQNKRKASFLCRLFFGKKKFNQEKKNKNIKKFIKQIFFAGKNNRA